MSSKKELQEQNLSDFLQGDVLTVAIKDLLSNPVSEVRCAVAFWGNGSQHLLKGCDPSKTKIICNLQTGGTNPRVIEELIKAGFLVKQYDTLHAKLYISDKAIVSSANASINGLGLQGQEQAGWLEAGAFVAVNQAERWFDMLWNEAKSITGKDIKKYKILFQARQRRRPTRLMPTVAFEDENYPLLEWYTSIESENDYEKIAKDLRRVVS